MKVARKERMSLSLVLNDKVHSWGVRWSAIRLLRFVLFFYFTFFRFLHAWILSSNWFTLARSFAINLPLLPLDYRYHGI